MVAREMFRMRSFLSSPRIRLYPQPVALAISMISWRISTGFRRRPRLRGLVPELLSLIHRASPRSSHHFCGLKVDRIGDPGIIDNELWGIDSWGCAVLRRTRESSGSVWPETLLHFQEGLAGCFFGLVGHSREEYWSR